MVILGKFDNVNYRPRRTLKNLSKNMKTSFQLATFNTLMINHFQGNVVFEKHAMSNFVIFLPSLKRFL